MSCVIALTVFSATMAMAQSTTQPASATVPLGPNGKPLTPAEIRLREKQAKWIEEQRRYKAEMAELQRRAQVEQAEKERKKKEKEEAKAREKQEREAAKLAKQQKETEKAVTPVTEPKPATPARTPVSAPAATGPVSAASPFSTISSSNEAEEKRLAKEKKEAEELARKQAKEAERERERQQKEADRIARQQAKEAERTKAAQTKQLDEQQRRQASEAGQTNAARQKAAQATAEQQRQQTLEAERLKAEQAKQTRLAEEKTRRQAEEAERTRNKEAKKVTEAPKPDATAEAAATVPESIQSSSVKAEFLPRGHLFAPITLDPLEAQTYLSVLPVFVIDGNRYDGAYVPFSFGFGKPFYRWPTKKGRAAEVGLDIASFTQFEVYRDENDVQRRQIVNNDYKVSIFYNLRSGRNSWRFRGYHLSSHLGDDYLIRNQINYRTPNPVNYELLDVTYSRDVQKLDGMRYYVNVGYGLRKPEERRKISAQAGFYYRKPNPASGAVKFVRPVAGIDLKMWQQNDFRPGIHFAAGIELGKSTNNSLSFLIESYTGFRPYSQYESQQIQWVGLGVYLNPF
ncbi:hypothetical protein BLX24_06550 [Arsenicibacter rosenii]|uniref:DUF1207 domain-containing protein n=2 Tax=Arsenicibacter rosenii TaxID=1750698 RepID=A0A1S2VP41_9BACT|nr:hypothetical protein BLX24_06550 [Arsenicibacter rosenii]